MTSGGEGVKIREQEGGGDDEEVGMRSECEDVKDEGTGDDECERQKYYKQAKSMVKSNEKKIKILNKLSLFLVQCDTFTRAILCALSACR